MHYTNGLGTNLTVEMPQNTLWVSAANEEHDNIIVNMPSYEIFHPLITEKLPALYIVLDL